MNVAAITAQVVREAHEVLAGATAGAANGEAGALSHQSASADSDPDPDTEDVPARTSETHALMDRLRGSVIGLEGSIGVGKSTFGDWLTAQGAPCALLSETAHHTCLDLFIADPKRFGGLFQNYMFSDCQNRVAQAQWAARQHGQVAVVDRTSWGNNVFARSNADRFSAAERQFYCAVRARQPLLRLDYLVYFDLAPDQCVERVGRRGTESEQQYQRQYFELLDTEYFHDLVEALAARQCACIVVPPGPRTVYPEILRRLVRLHRRETAGATVRLLGPDEEPRDGESCYDYREKLADFASFKRTVLADLARDRPVALRGWPTRVDPLTRDTAEPDTPMRRLLAQNPEEFWRQVDALEPYSDSKSKKLSLEEILKEAPPLMSPTDTETLVAGC